MSSVTKERSNSNSYYHTVHNECAGSVADHSRHGVRSLQNCMVRNLSFSCYRSPCVAEWRL